MTDIEDANQQGVKATPETVAKLRPDPFRLLYVRAQLDPNPYLNQRMWDAGLEIRTAFNVVVSPVSMRCTDYEREVRRTHWEAAEAMSQSRTQNARLVKRYNAWVDDMTRRHLPVGPILDVVVDGVSCREVDRSRRLGWRACVRILREGLKLYVRGAGWRKRAA